MVSLSTHAQGAYSPAFQPDVSATRNGIHILYTPNTEDARQWLLETVHNAVWWGTTLACHEDVSPELLRMLQRAGYSVGG